MYEIDRLARVRARLHQDRRTRPHRLFALAHGEPFLATVPLGLLAVHDQTLLAQQDMEMSIAEASALAGHNAHALSQRGVVRALASIADRRPIRSLGWSLASDGGKPHGSQQCQRILPREALDLHPPDTGSTYEDSRNTPDLRKLDIEWER